MVNLTTKILNMAEQKRFIGVDLSKRSFEVAMVNDNTSQITRKKYKATTEGRQEFVASLREDDVVAMETGNSSFVLAKLIQKYVHCKVYVLNAGKLHIIFRSLKKRDKEDALRIAKFIQRMPEEELPTVAMPSDEEMAMRSTVAEQMRLDRSRTRSLNALYNLLWNNGVSGIGRTELKKEKNREKAISKLPEVYKDQGRRLVQLIDMYEQYLNEIEENQKEVLQEREEETTISLSMPGIGPKIAFVLQSYLGNMERFNSRRQIGYFAGFTPRVDSSGDRERYGSITKKGPKRVRQVMVQAAWAAMQSNQGTVLKEVYKRIRSTKGKKKAIVAVARKMLEILYVMHTRKELYSAPGLADHS